MTDTIDKVRAALADRYGVTRELGAGGMATVYLATDLKHGRDVAIKVLKPELAASLGVERFHREIEIAARLQHPHILGLLDSGDAGGFLYYVMPYVEGVSLRERLDRSGELPVNEAVRILRDIVDALAYAHAKGVTHRDVKPENVMLSGRHALVTDFGVAKALSAATGSGSNVTTAGVALGTPAYMSPEQATADPQADHRSDLYSVGVVAYELVSGTPPFVGGNAQTILARHVTEQPAPVLDRRSGLPPALAALVMRSLEKRPADRFQSAEEMLSQLEALSTGTTPVDTRPVPAVRAPMAQGRRAGVAAAVVVVAVAIVVGVRSRGDTPEIDRRAGPPSVGVLPFTELNAPAGQEYFADGLTEEVIGALSRMPSLRVPGRASSMHFKGSRTPVRAIAESLSVRSILSASIQRADDRVRIRADLVHAEDGFQLWSETYDESVENLFAVYDRVAQSIAGALKVRLVVAGDSTVAAYARAASRPSTNPEAYNAYLIGRHQLNLRTSAAVDSARLFFERALAADSAYAPAWSGLADAYTLSTPAQYRVRGISAPEALDRALAAARRAVALAPSSGEAFTSLGLAHEQRWEWDEAEAAWKQALALDPNFAPLRHYHGVGLMGLGRFEEAEREFARAEELDPLYWITGAWRATALWLLGRRDDAQRKYDDLIARHPEVSRLHAEAGIMALRRGDYDRAGTEFGLVFERAGDPDRARWVREGMRRAERRVEVGSWVAQSGELGLTGARRIDIAMWSGNRARATELLQNLPIRPGEQGPAGLRAAVTHPDLLALPVWKDHLRRMGVTP